MAGGISVNGAAADLRWARGKIATLTGWSVVRTEAGGWQFHGTVSDLDEYAASQRPLEIVTPNGWHWPVETLQITDGTLTASIRPKE